MWLYHVWASRKRTNSLRLQEPSLFSGLHPSRSCLLSPHSFLKHIWASATLSPVSQLPLGAYRNSLQWSSLCDPSLPLPQTPMSLKPHSGLSIDKWLKFAFSIFSDGHFNKWSNILWYLNLLSSLFLPIPVWHKLFHRDVYCPRDPHLHQPVLIRSGNLYSGWQRLVQLPVTPSSMPLHWGLLPMPVFSIPVG